MSKYVLKNCKICQTYFEATYKARVDSKTDAKFQNPRTTPSLRKVCDPVRRKKNEKKNNHQKQWTLRSN